MVNETTVKVNVDVDTSGVEELATLLENLQSTGETVGSTISSSITDITSELENATSAAEDLNSALENNDGSSLDIAADSASNLSAELDSAANSAQEVNDTLSGVDSSGLEDVAESAEKASEELEESSENSKTFSEKTTGWITASNYINEFASKVGSLNGSFMAINDTLGVAAVNTGYSIDQVRELAIAYAEVGTSTSDAATYLQRFQNSGLEPASQGMDKAMNNAHLLQTAFRMTGSEANSLMGALSRAGIGSEDLADSFNALGYMSANTNISIDTFQSVLTTAGAAMEDNGVSIDVAAVALKNINGRYRTARQAASAFNEAVKESEGDISKLEELLDLQAGTLQNASAETATAAGVVDELSQSYVDAQGPLAQYQTYMDQISTSLSGYLGPIANISSTFTDMFAGLGDVKTAYEILRDLKRSIFGYTEEISGGVEETKKFVEHAGLVDKIGPGWDNLKEKVSNFKDKLSEINFISFEGLKGKIDSIKSKLSEMVNNISFEGLKGKIDSIKSKISGINTISLEGLKSKFSSLKEKISSVNTVSFEGLKGKLSSLKGSMQGVITKASILGGKLLDVGKKALIAGANALSSVASWMAAGAAQLWASIQAGMLAIAEWAAASPILALVLVIGALIAILAYLYFNNETVRNAINQLGQAIMSVAQWIWDTLIAALEWLSNLFMNLGTTISNFVNGAITAILNFVNMVVQGFLSFISFIASIPGQIWSFLSQIVSRVTSWASSMISKAVSTGKNFVSNLINQVKSIPGKIIGELQKVTQKVIEWGKDLIKQAIQIGSDFVTGVLSFGMGQNSPGYTYDGFVLEMTSIQGVIDKFHPIIAAKARVFGEDVTDNFTATNGSLTAGLSNDLNTIKHTNLSSNNSVGASYVDNRTINLEIGSVDNEERVNEIVDVIRRELSWSNKTAGRTN